MTSEIFAFIQAQAQTLQQTQTHTESSDTQPGLFDSVMAGLTESDPQTEQADPNTLTLIPAETQEIPQTMTFTGTFTQSVMDILAGQQDTPETLEATLDTFGETISQTIDNVKDALNESGLIEDIKRVVGEVKTAVTQTLDDSDVNEMLSRILSDEGITAKLDELFPEETKQEVIRAISEMVSDLKDSDAEMDTLFREVADVLTEHLTSQKAPVSVPEGTQEAHVTHTARKPAAIPSISDDEDDDDDDSDDTDTVTWAEPQTEDYSLAGSMTVIASAQTVTPAIVPVEPEANPESTPEAAPELTTQSGAPVQTPKQAPAPQTRNVSRETQTTTQTPDSDSETPKASTSFDDALEHIETRQNPSDAQTDSGTGQDREDDSQQGQSQTQTQSPNGTSRNVTNRTRASASSRTQSESRTSSERSSSARTDSRNTFQSFFEGVLSNRRTASRTSPQPLSLGATYTQSQTLRTGIVNVVRFIRADGVQKANVVVDPPALGRITVELTSSTSGVEASIKVASEQIRQLVQDQLSELRMNLSQQGVQVAEFTVDVQQDSTGNQNHQEDGNNYRTFGITEADDDDEAEEFRVDLEDGLLYWVA